MPSANFVNGLIKCNGANVPIPTFYSSGAQASIPPYNVDYYSSNPYVSIYTDRILLPYTAVESNMNSPLVVKKSNALQGDWAVLVANHDGTYHQMLDFDNGKTIWAMYQSGRDYINIRVQNGNNILGTFMWDVVTTSYPIEYALFTVLKFDDTFLFEIITLRNWDNAYSIFIEPFLSSTANYYYTSHYLTDGIVTYNWQSVEQLVGNEGQFRMNLSQVQAEYIGSGLTQDATTDASRFVISDMSLLRTLTNNCAAGEEVIIGYCGRNYMTFTRDTSDTRSGVLKFYYVGGLLAYTSPLFVVNPSNTQFKYLCLYKDIPRHAGMLQTITISLNDPEYPSYSYNELYTTYGATEPTDDDLLKMWIWLSDNGHIEENINPYDTGTTDDGGEPGNPRPQDKITDSPLPTLSGLESGIVTLYRPTATQLTQISAFLWSNDVLDNFKKYFNNFADNILSLSIMPYTPSGLSTKLFKVGNMQSVDIGQVEYSTQRFYDIPMGSVNINKLWGSYLDYSPYTKCEIYLPYLGLHSLDIDELMSPCKLDGSMPATQGCTLTLTYRLDILTGVIVAKIAVTNDYISNQIRYQFSGKCGASIPLTGQTYAQLVQSMATIGAGLISTVATSGMAAPMIAGAAAVAATVQSQKPSVERIGNISGDASMLATNVPYIILSSPNKALLEKQEEFTGFPSYKSGALQNFTGYCEVIDAHVEGISCTEEERAEILSLLKAGVII